MLAALDDEESDNASPIKASNRPLPQKAISNADALTASASEEDDDDDDNDAPRGKMAARLQANSSAENDAYERIRMQVQQKTPATKETRSQHESDSDSEPAVARRATRVARHQSKSPAKSATSSLSGKFMLRKKTKAITDSSDEDAGGAALPLSHQAQSNERASPDHVQARSLAVTPRKQASQAPGSPAPSAGGLFLSPDAPRRTAREQVGSDSDEDFDLAKASRLSILVEKKRAERRAKEAEEEKKRQERRQQSGAQQSISDFADSEDDDVAASRKLTQQSRPTRKASKKAIEEMNREQQRIQRGMQLAHEATTKKKIDKGSFLARFNYPGAKAVDQPKTVQPLSSATCSSAPASDIEGKEAHQTPPTSPIRPIDSEKETQIDQPQVAQQNDLRIQRIELDHESGDNRHDLPSLFSDIDTSSSKGKGKVLDPAVVQTSSETNRPSLKHRPIKIHPPSNPVAPNRVYGDDSDSDLDILPAGHTASPKKSSRKLDIFDRLPQKAISGPNPSLLRLRALAQIKPMDDNKNNKGKHSVSSNQLGLSLQRRARQQAAKERMEKIRELEAKGIVVQTAEERARDQAQVEDILEKNRQEADDLKQKEKEQKRENGEDVESSDDEDYEDEADASDDEGSIGDQEADVELSGSEDEEAEDLDTDGGQGLALFENEAAESDNGEEEEEILLRDIAEDEDEDEDEIDLPVVKSKRRSNHQRIVEDDDEEEEEHQVDKSRKEPTQSTERATPAPSAVHDMASQVQNPFAMPAGTAQASPQVNNPFAAVAAPMLGEAPLGLTQAFASTLSDGVEQSQEQDSMQALNDMPMPDFPIHDIATQQAPSQLMRTQTMDSLQIDLNFEQSQLQDSMQQEPTMPPATQLSEFPDPTQDVGFGAVSPVKNVPAMARAPSSTLDTILMESVQVQQSPVVQRKLGRLQRGKDARTGPVAVFSDEEASSEDETSANAFDVLRRSAKQIKPVEAFDKKASKAKQMFEEQAEESEDEYAGLGGAEGEDSDEEPDATLQQMIDESHVEVDEQQLAALYADKDRADDEAAMQKLARDLQNGGLRRKRGADFDLDDSDDDIERRRVRRRVEEARMRKALLDGDANVGKIAEDPKKKAFLRAIEDREPDGDFAENDWLREEDLDAGEQSTQEVPESQVPASQTENQDPAAARAAMPAPELKSSKRKRVGEDPSKAHRRPFRQNKPTSLADLRATISSLTEDPRDMSMASTVFSASDSSADESSNKNSMAPRPRRTQRQVVDRLAMKRAESQNSNNNDASVGGPRLAFQDSNANATAVFKVPSLLRRATSSNLNSMTDANGISHHVERTERAIGEQKGEFFKKAGGKKSSVNFFAREEARGKVLGERERRKEAERKKIAEGRKGALGGVLGGGSWE
jgi:mediator of replication checkpoint protein 1